MLEQGKKHEVGAVGVGVVAAVVTTPEAASLTEELREFADAVDDAVQAAAAKVSEHLDALTAELRKHQKENAIVGDDDDDEDEAEEDEETLDDVNDDGMRGNKDSSDGGVGTDAMELLVAAVEALPQPAIEEISWSLVDFTVSLVVSAEGCATPRCVLQLLQASLRGAAKGMFLCYMTHLVDCEKHPRAWSILARAALGLLLSTETVRTKWPHELLEFWEQLRASIPRTLRSTAAEAGETRAGEDTMSVLGFVDGILRGLLVPSAVRVSVAMHEPQEEDADDERTWTCLVQVCVNVLLQLMGLCANASLDAEVLAAWQEAIHTMTQALNLNLFQLLTASDLKDTQAKVVSELDVDGIQWPATPHTDDEHAQVSADVRSIIAELTALTAKRAVFEDNTVGKAVTASLLFPPNAGVGAPTAHSVLACGDYCMRHLHRLATTLIAMGGDSKACEKGVALLEYIVAQQEKGTVGLEVLEQAHFGPHDSGAKLLDVLQSATIYASTQQQALSRARLFQAYVRVFDDEARYSIYAVLCGDGTALDAMYQAYFPLLKEDVVTSLSEEASTMHKTLFRGTHLWGLIDKLTGQEKGTSAFEPKSNIHKISIVLNFLRFLLTFAGEREGKSSLEQRIESNVLDIWDESRLDALLERYLTPLKRQLSEDIATVTSQDRAEQAGRVQKDTGKLLMQLNIASFITEEVATIVQDALSAME